MAEHIIKELEAAAQILLAPPNIVNNEQRHSAELVFLNFKKTKSPYSICRDILETSKNDFVLFEAASLLKDAIIRDWSTLQENDLTSLRQYLLHYVMEKISLPPFVRERIVQVAAIMVKRSSVDDFGSDRSQVLNDVQHLILSGDPPRQLIACSIMSALIQEYAITVKSSDVGLTWETHFKAKKQFQATELKHIFQFCLQALGELVKVETVSGQVLSLFQHLLSIAQAVLSWGFISGNLPKRLIGLFESVLDSDSTPTLRLGGSWKDVILDPNVINLFFEIHWKIRENPDLSYLSLACLTQLASLNGTVVSAKDARIQYISHFLQAFIKLVNNVQIMDREALGISNIVRKLLLYIPPPVLLGLPTLPVTSLSSPHMAGPSSSSSSGFQAEEHLLHTFLNQMTKLTCQFAMGAALEESTCSEDHMYTEAFGNMLSAWTLVLHDSQVLPRHILQESSIQIFNTYLKCHLSPPDGNRGQGREIDVEEIDETEEDDRTKFKDQLEAIGDLGRQVLGHSLPLLSRLIEERTRRLQTHLQKMMQIGSGSSAASHGGTVVTIADTSALDCLFEDIHWLILIAGHVCCMVSEGETALIPQEVMHHSIEQVSQYSLDGGGGWAGGGAPIVEASLRLLASSPSLPPPPQETAEMERSDHVIRLVAAMFRVSEVERQAYEGKLGHLLSPEVSCTLLWFLQRWAISYLLPNETFYSEVSKIFSGLKMAMRSSLVANKLYVTGVDPISTKEISMTLISAFGRDTEAAIWTVSFMLSKVQSNLRFCGSEPGVMKDTILLLIALVDTKDKGSYVLKCEGLWNIVAKLAQGNDSEWSIPQTAKRGIYRALVLAGAATESEQARSEYWGQLLRPLQDRFKQLICQENFSRVFHQEKIRFELIDLLESFIGVAQGSQASTVNSLFQFLGPIMGELPALLALTHNYSQLVQIILDFYCECLRRMLCHLNQADTQKTYEWCLQLIRTYANCSLGRRTIETSAEEEAYHDILLLMELLTNLLSKDFIDLAPLGPESGLPQVSAADVCLLGLSTLMPFVSPELLCFPSLCSKYFRLITFACEIFPGKLSSLPSSLSQPLLASVQMGLSGSYGAEAVGLCFDFIQVLGTHIYTNRLNGTSIHEDLRPFLKLFMSYILTHQFNSDLMTNASSATYVLICCYQEDYKCFVQELLNSQSDPSIASRLAQSFTDLTAGLEFNTNRQNRMRFKENFMKFVVNVHGFMLVK